MTTRSEPTGWAAHAPQLAEWTSRWLVNRTDVWGGYYLGQDNQVRRTTRPATKDRGRLSLTTTVLARHYAATRCDHVVGLHTTSPANTSRWGAVDVDNHDGAADPGANLAAVLGWYARAHEAGLTAVLADSNGAGGYHLLAIFAEPNGTPVVHDFMRHLTRDWAELGLAQEPECFPKQAAIAADGVGNWLRLPGLHHTHPHWSRVWDGDTWLTGGAAAAYVLTLAGSGTAPVVPRRPASPPPTGEEAGRDTPGTGRPGDDFNRRATWEEILEPHGWVKDRLADGVQHWTRPGKDGGTSATTGFCKGEATGERFYSFSTNCAPFQPERGYDKFGAYAVLNHGGNLEAAARELASRRSGQRESAAGAAAHARNGHHRANGHAKAPKADPERTASDVVTITDLERLGAQVEWVWPLWLQRGVLNAIAAEGGTGKTRFVADLVRRVRTAGTWPDGQRILLPADSLALWVVSDNNHAELVSLCKSFGIGESVRINAYKDNPFGGVLLDLPEDLAELKRRVELVRPVFVVVDTVGNATDRNLSVQEDAKGFFAPLQVIARETNAAFLCLTHLNAAGSILGRRAREKVRVEIRMERPEGQDRRRLEVTKTNSKYPPPLGVTMCDDGNQYDAQPPAKTEPGSGGRSAPRLAQATKWLDEQLAGGPAKVADLRDDADEEGINAKLLYRAKERLGVIEFMEGRRKFWRLPEEGEEDLPDDPAFE